MAVSVKHFINGVECANHSSEQHEIYNPAKGTVIATVAFADAAEIEMALAAAAQAFKTWSETPPLQRARVLFKFKVLLEQHQDEIATLITTEHGKVLEDARGEVSRAIELVEHCCGMPNMLKGTYSENVSRGIDCYTVRQPLGVCVGVTPFNFPVMVSTWMFIPAIACGNTFILKPSEKDPSAPLLLAKLLHQAGLPPGVFNIINGDKTAVDVLITDKRVKAVSCVGSTPVAKSIYETAIKHGKRAQTFGGAKNHCIIMPDANLDDAADSLLGAAYGAAGERCMAVSVAVVIGDQQADLLAKKIGERIPSLKIGSGLDSDSQMGPLVTKEHRERVKSYVALGVKEGATLLHDGCEHNVKGEYEKGFFMGACLFDHVTPCMQIYQEEIFGPVLCIVRQPNLDSAINLINQHQFGNGVAIFTHDGASAREFAHRIQVGMVGINVPIPVPVSYHSFGGWKDSVFGDVAMHGEEGLLFYTKPKSVTVRWQKNEKLNAAYHMPIN